MPGSDVNTGKLPLCKGTVNKQEVRVLRDTGCTMIGCSEKFINVSDFTDETVKCKTITGDIVSLRTAFVDIDTPFFKGRSRVCVLPQSAVADVIIGNVDGVLQCNCFVSRQDDYQVGCAVTRSMTNIKKNTKQNDVFVSFTLDPVEFKNEQVNDTTLINCHNKVGQDAMNGIDFIIYNNYLYRRHTSDRKVTEQLVVPKKYRDTILKIAHDIPMSGHQGIRRTKARIINEFYWPQMYTDINKYLKSCHICQKTASKGRSTKAPLQQTTIVGKPFERIAVDLIGPLYKSDRNHQYILTVVDFATKWVEAIPLKSTTSDHVAEALTTIFTRLGIPSEILSDRGPQFVSDLMSHVMRLMGIKQVFSSPYHPQTNGLCERLNGTIKSLLKKVAFDHPKDWDRLLPCVLFAYRESPQESTEFSPFELLYGRTPRGPMAILKDLCINDKLDQETKSSYQYVLDLEQRIGDSCKLASDNVVSKAKKYATYADRTAKLRELSVGDKVLILLPMTKNKLLMKWKGPYEVIKRISKVNYSIMIKGQLKVFHINMLKQYHEREEDCNAFMVAAVAVIYEDDVNDQSEENVELPNVEIPSIKQTEDYTLVYINDSLPHDKIEQIRLLLKENKDVLTDMPGKSVIGNHSIHVYNKEPINLKPYPLPLQSEQIVIDEVKKMLDMGVIEHSSSPYSSPIVLVKKKDGNVRFCIDFRKLNKNTIPDRETIPNPEEIFTKLSQSTIFSKIDLSKGYWQIPMEGNSKMFTAFQTPIGLMQWKFMPFGLSNAPATFARTMRQLLADIPNVVSYFDDILIHTNSWDEHIQALLSVFDTLRKKGFTARPSKMSIGCEEIEFLGHVITNGVQKPYSANLNKILNLEIPKTKKQIRALMGLAGYYRKFIPNFADITAPLTNLLTKGSPDKIIWSDNCANALATVQTSLSSNPILILPNINELFIVRTDASGVGMGGVLLQMRDDKLMPCLYASRKLNDAERKYSVIERECLAIVFSLAKFSKYLLMSDFIVETDHRPLTFMTHGKAKNSRLMRWSLALQQYNFRIRAIPGRENHHADALSRLV